MATEPPVNPLTQAQVDVLLTFEGFGRLDAPVWFLGMEEAGDNPQLLHTRATWQSPVMDLKYAHVESLGIEKHHRANVASVVLQSTWRPMCVLMVLGDAPELYVPNPANFSELTHAERQPFLDQRQKLVEKVRLYQSTRLGRGGEQGQTLLCELLPIPKPAENVYPFANVLPMWTDHYHYKADVLPGRKELLAGRLAEHRPEIVVAYGKAFWDDYRDLFPGTEFADANEEQCKQLPSWFPDGKAPDEKHSKILFGQHGDRTLVVLTPHLTRVNDYARLAELASLLRHHRSKLAGPPEALP